MALIKIRQIFAPVRLYRLLVVLAIIWLISTKKTPIQSSANHSIFYPESSCIEDRRVTSDDGTHLGFFLTTSPQTDHLRGYSGPTNVAMKLDPSGRLEEALIVDSADTPDHVKAVVDAEEFWKAHFGLPLGAPGSPEVDAVSGSTLTSQAISRSIVERLGGTTSSRLFPTEILAAEIPEAHSLKDHPDWHGVKVMYDKNRTVVGYAMRTGPDFEFLHGYQGPTDILIVLGPEAEKIHRLRFRKSFDNEDYYERILDHPEFLELYNGLAVSEVTGIDYQREGIEGVSGATLTSWAIAESVRRRLVQFEADRSPAPSQIPWRNFSLLALSIGAITFAFTSLRGKVIPRILWQVAVVVTLGIIFGDLLSQALLLGWSKHGIPWKESWGLVFLAAAALLIPWATGRQLYCHQLCPHGFLQRWLGKLPFKPVKIPKKIHRILSHIPGLLLILLVGSVILGLGWNFAAFEAFDAWLWQAAGLATIILAILGLVASVFVPLAYCKYGCPTGALFNFLRKSSAKNQFGFRDAAAGILCLAASIF